MLLSVCRTGVSPMLIPAPSAFAEMRHAVALLHVTTIKPAPATPSHPLAPSSPEHALALALAAGEHLVLCREGVMLRHAVALLDVTTHKPVPATPRLPPHQRTPLPLPRENIWCCAGKASYAGFTPPATNQLKGRPSISFAAALPGTGTWLGCASHPRKMPSAASCVMGPPRNWVAGETTAARGEGQQ